MSAAELLEAAFRAMRGLGCERGLWQVELRLEEGHVRRLRATRLNGESPVTLGRAELARRPAA